MAITLSDVARAAGVNISTVSRALRGAYGVHRRTRQKVMEAAERLHYRPNRVARGLATGRSHTLGLIISDIRNPYFAEVARGAEDAARRAGYDLVLCNADLDPLKQMRYVRSLLEKRVDGLLMNSVADLNRQQQQELAACGAPIVLLNPPGTGQTFSTVTGDNFEGGRLAGAYLLGLGHRHIAHVTGPRRHGNLAARARGFLRAMQAAGARAKAVVIHGAQSYQGGYEMTRKLLAEHPKVTAIFAGNDAMAFGAIRAALEAGLAVPEDLSLVGFDNVELSAIIRPPLTTIHQPKYEMGQAAVEILLRAAGRQGAALPEHLVLGVELVERQSCGAPRPRGAPSASVAAG